MKKRNVLIILLCSFMLLLCIGCLKRSREVLFDKDEEGNFVVSLRIGEEIQQLHPYYDASSNVYYFFLPAFVKDNQIYNDSFKLKDLTIDGKRVSLFNSISWEENTVYSISCESLEDQYDVIFMHSANLHSLFIETDSGNLDSIHENKNNEEGGSITVVSENGSIECNSELSRFSGRGNTTYRAGKKPYTFTLDTAQELCGIEKGKRWNLLALYYENDKIHSKIVYDMARYLGMEYAVGSNWVDLYCNGSYMGLYLLTEAVSVGDGRVEISDLEEENEKRNAKADLAEYEVKYVKGKYAYYDIEEPENITGGYLIEKVYRGRINDGEPFFKTDIYDFYFTIKTPKHISEQEIIFIQQYIQNIENLINADGEYWEYIDMESFAKQYLIDKIVLNNDAMWESSFFYKDKDSEVLKAGPIWDYDRAFGAILSDYTRPIEDAPNAMAGWYSHFYRDEEFKEHMIKYYKEVLPYLQWICEEGIDEYVNYISASLKMDNIIMSEFSPNETSCYESYDNYIRYLKFFIAARINYLNDLWEINSDGIDIDIPTGDNKYHLVQFWNGNECVGECMVRDGEMIDQFPTCDLDDDYVWKKDYTGKEYDTFIPIYEDVDLYIIVEEPEDKSSTSEVSDVSCRG
ncbi:MAG: CotH kinase family protein [Bacillota bacterium]|nr:CotH kinase family protein [Bacillota bacterium]